MELLIGCGSNRDKKVCSKCGQAYPATAEFFNRANWIASGLRPDCKKCYSQAKKVWWEKQTPPNRPERRAQASLLAQGQRKCRICAQIQPADYEHFARVGKTGWETTCRECSRRRTRLWYRFDLLSRFGVDVEAYRGAVCAICKKPETDATGRRLALDHCHKRNIFRGFLCRKCNSGLGHFDDKPELLHVAAGYLERFREPQEYDFDGHA